MCSDTLYFPLLQCEKAVESKFDSEYAYGGSGKEAGLDGKMIKARQLEYIAGK